MSYFYKKSIFDVRLCSEYASEFSCKRSLGWWGTNIFNTHETSTKTQSVIEWYWCGKRGAIDKNAGYLCCDQAEIVEYLAWDTANMNAVTQKVKNCLWNSSFLKVATLLNLNRCAIFRTRFQRRILDSLK